MKALTDTIIRHSLIAFLLLTCLLSSLASGEGDLSSPATPIEKPSTSSSSPRSNSSKSKSPPHIIYILADDLGWNDVGYHNELYEDEIRTPHIDRLSHEGVRLDNYYVQSVCTPTRSVLLTGKYQIHTGLQHSIIQSAQPSALGTEHKTIAEELKPLGYSTHIVGKWHLGYYRTKFQPLQRGFDTFYGFYGGGEFYYAHQGRCEFPGWQCPDEKGCWGFDFFDQGEPVKDSVGKYSTNLLTQRAVDLIEAHEDSDKPMFLYLPYQAVHGPLEAPAETVAKFAHIEDVDRRIYAAMVYKLDEGIGNITKALKASGMYNNSVIIFSTDNGGHNGSGGNNWPLRGSKGSYWEGGIRGVGFVHSPLLKETHAVRKQLIHVSDWLPTILSLAGGEPSTEVDGVDQWETISQGRPSARTEILHTIDPVGLDIDTVTGTKQAALRAGRYKILVGNPGQNLQQDGWEPSPHFLPPPSKPSSRLRGPIPSSCLPCHFTLANLTNGVCLFDIETDPIETCNLATTHPEVVQRLLNRLEAYNATSVPVQYPPPSALCDPALYPGDAFVAWGDLADQAEEEEGEQEEQQQLGSPSNAVWSDPVEQDKGQQQLQSISSSTTTSSNSNSSNSKLKVEGGERDASSGSSTVLFFEGKEILAANEVVMKQDGLSTNEFGS